MLLSAGELIPVSLSEKAVPLFPLPSISARIDLGRVIMDWEIHGKRIVVAWGEMKGESRAQKNGDFRRSRRLEKVRMEQFICPKLP